MRKSLMAPGAAILLALGAAAPAGADVVLPPGAPVAGRTQSDLSADWWQWAYSFPTSVNPLFDLTGAQAQRGNLGDRFYLAGVLGLTQNPLNATATRTITVPAGVPIFFPLLNAEVDNPSFNSPGVPPPSPPLTVAELRAFAADFAANVTELHASVDGVPIPGLFSHRQISPVFSYTLPATDNVLQSFGYTLAGTIDPAVGDGYYVALAGLPPGPHVINFGGTFNGFTPADPTDDFKLDITYFITAVPEPSSLALLALGGTGLAGWRRWKRKHAKA